MYAHMILLLSRKDSNLPFGALCVICVLMCCALLCMCMCVSARLRLECSLVCLEELSLNSICIMPALPAGAGLTLTASTLALFEWVVQVQKKL